MAVSIIKLAEDLQRELALPAGYHVVADTETDNILVHGADLGFCITRKYIEDHDFASLVTTAKDVAKDLVARHGSLIRPTAELFAEDRSVTQFDEAS
jgi:hypothetical protein